MGQTSKTRAAASAVQNDLVVAVTSRRGLDLEEKNRSDRFFRSVMVANIELEARQPRRGDSLQPRQDEGRHPQVSERMRRQLPLCNPPKPGGR